MQTANGELTADTKVELQIDGLPSEPVITPHVLPDAMPVLSIGRRAQQLGYGFIWEPYSDRPILISPQEGFCMRNDQGHAIREYIRSRYGGGGRKLPKITELYVEHFVPYLVEAVDEQENPGKPVAAMLDKARAQG